MKDDDPTAVVTAPTLLTITSTATSNNKIEEEEEEKEICLNLLNGGDHHTVAAAAAELAMNGDCHANDEIGKDEEKELHLQQDNNKSAEKKINEEEAALNGPNNTKTMQPDPDETCFKTPTMPVNNGKKVRTASTKKRPKVSADQVNGGGGGRTPLSAAAAVTPEQTSSITADWITCSDGTNSCSSSSSSSHHFQPNVQQQQYTDQEFLRDYVSIGKHSFLCPRAQQSLAKRFPGLVLTRNLDNPGEEGKREEDVIQEIIIDEFSLLLFNSMEDYNLLKEREDRMKEIEEAQAKQRQYEENLRLGKIKKKGRKSKAELRREKKEAKLRAHKERKEQRRREHEERKRIKLQQQQQNGSASSTSTTATQIDEQKQQERRERREAQKAERKKCQEEKKRQKQAERRMRQQQNNAEKKLLATAAAAITSPAAVLTETFVVPSTSNAAAQPHELLQNSGNLAKIKIEKLDEENQAPSTNAPGRKNSAGNNAKSGVKRPSNLSGGTIGIASVHHQQHHHRNGLIAAGNNHQFLPAMAPASKIPKMESGPEEFGANNRGLLIGISSNPFGIPNGFNGLDQPNKGMADGISSVPSTSSFAQQEQLQQMLFKNPELAYNFQQSLATLYSMDPALVAKAAAGGFSSSLPFGSSNPSMKAEETSKTLNDQQQQRMLAAGSIIGPTSGSLSTGGLLPSFPLGVPLASQLATLAATQGSSSKGTNAAAIMSNPSTVPFKSGRWCNMHAVIAHEIAKHQDASKKGTGRTPSIGIAGRHPSTSSGSTRSEKKAQQQKPVEAAHTNAAQLQNVQQQEQQLREKIAAAVAATASLPSSSSAPNTSANSLQQQLNLLLAQQQRSNNQQGALLNDSFASSLGLLSRLQAGSTKPVDQLLPSANPLGLSSLSQQLFSSVAPQQTTSSAQSAQSSQLFGGFPIQPPGPGTGSLTSGNSDAAAAAQLQQQAKLLAALQQQQAQYMALQQQLAAAPLSQSSLASLVAAQFGAGAACPTPGLLQQPTSQQLLSALMNTNSAGTANSQQFGLGQSTGQLGLPLSSSFHQSQQLSSLDHSLQTLPNLNSLLSAAANNGNETTAAGAESILAAFLSGQSIEPKVAFPPQLPSTSSAAAAAPTNPLSSPSLNMEQQLLRSQFQQQLSKMSAASTIPPPPSSLIAGSMATGGGTAAGSSTTHMNPIEQELLMRQLRMAQQQMANGHHPSKAGEMLGGGSQQIGGSSSAR